MAPGDTKGDGNVQLHRFHPHGSRFKVANTTI